MFISLLFLPQLEHEYKGKLGQILDVEFLPCSAEFASSCDVVSRDSADRTIMVWDLRTTAVVSNQLYHVRRQEEIFSYLMMIFILDYFLSRKYT